MRKLRQRFQGIYWQQMFVITGVVLLTLFLLGASFFSLSYHYTKNQKEADIQSRAKVMSQLSVSYLESGRFMSMEELRSDPDFQRLASFAAVVSDAQFMICDTEGHVLLTTDEDLSGQVVTMPEKMTQEILEKGASSERDDLGGLYENRRLWWAFPR